MRESGEPAPFAFVVGCPRSGTTMLRGMLDSHPRLSIPLESHFIPGLRERLEAPPGPGPLDVELLVQLLREDPRFRAWDLPEAVLDDSLLAAAPRSLAEALRHLYAAYAEAHGATRYGDKTPQYVSHMDDLAALVPEARFVHLVRDGRDVAASLRDAPFGPDSLARCALRWRTLVARGLRSAARLGGRRCLLVRYERLVRDPEVVLRRICRFLELTYDERMLGYHRRADEILGAVADRPCHQSVRRPPTPGLRDWARDLREDEIAAVEHVAGDLLDRLDYPRHVRDVPLPVRLEADADVLGLRLRQRLAGLRQRAAALVPGPGP